MKKKYFLLSGLCFVQLLTASENDKIKLTHYLSRGAVPLGSTASFDTVKNKGTRQQITQQSPHSNKSCGDYCCGAMITAISYCLDPCLFCCQKLSDCCSKKDST